MKYLLFVLFVCSFAACDDSCTPEDTRCRGRVVEICNTDSRWETVMDCSVVSPGSWYCVPPDTDGDTDPSTMSESAHCEQEVF